MSRACRAYKLEEAMQLFCHLQGNHNLRGFKGYMVTASLVWEELFQKTLWNFTKEWLPVQWGNPYPYILLPEDISLFMGIFDEAEVCKGKSVEVQLDFDNRSSTLQKPELKACGCNVNCGCGGTCATANSFVREEIEHVVEGDTYIENKWLETCKNGDVIEWREVPAKVYKHGIAVGEFNPDDFDENDINTEGVGFDIEVVTLQRRICTLKIKPCGCIEESDYNKNLLKECCASDGVIRNFMFDECCTATKQKTKLRRDDSDPRKVYIIGGAKKQYLLKFQRSGASEKSLVPQYALKALWMGVNHYSTMLNPSVVDKKTPEFDFIKAKKDVVKDLNPITQRTLDILQTSRKQM